jgi:hypothetical protein
MFSDVTTLAQLEVGGHPTNPDHWHASIFEPPASDSVIVLGRDDLSANLHGARFDMLDLYALEH